MFKLVRLFAKFDLLNLICLFLKKKCSLINLNSTNYIIMHRHVIKQLMVGAALLDVGLLSCRNARFSIPMNPSTIRNVRFRKKNARASA